MANSQKTAYSFEEQTAYSFGEKKAYNSGGPTAYNKEDKLYAIRWTYRIQFWR